MQNLSYGYDKFGNLASWKDNLRNLEETFHYDKMNRLTDIYLGTTHSQIVYDPLGRMTDKQADGQAVFADADFTGVSGQPARPHAMKSAATAEGVFPLATQEIAYTGFDKVKTIAEGGSTLAYTYGYDQQRIRMVENVGDITRTKDYVGVCEYITEDDGENTTEKTLTYLVGPYGVFAVVEQLNSEESMHYILKDHLGSWTTITDAEGNVEQELSFDAWGNLRDPETWSGSYSGTPMFDRGFTGHEHMTAFGLINMNGRCYDPLTSSFLSVDAFVQDPTSAQAFNRYAYCGYNPLRYTDPTGWYADGYGRQPQPQCYDPTARYHSDDPNDVLWGRSVHPWENSSSGFVNGTAVTCTGYTEGNNDLSGNNNNPNRAWYKLKNGQIVWYPYIDSSEQLEKLGIEYLGQTYIDKENSIYYSLLGYKIDMTAGDDLAGDLIPLLDEAFCKYNADRSFIPTDPQDVFVQESSTINLGVRNYNQGKDNLYYFKTNHMTLYLQVFNESLGLKQNSMDACFRGFDDADRFNPNSNWGHSAHTTFQSGYNIYFNNPYANSRCWRAMIVFPTALVRDEFIGRYNQVFGHGK